FGLIYPPGVYSGRKELVSLASRLSSHHTLACHMRNESTRLEESIEEICDVAAQSGANLQISHLKLSGRDNWGEAGRYIELLRDKINSGQSIHVDVYPYIAASTKLSACLPPWALEGSAEATLQ